MAETFLAHAHQNLAPHNGKSAQSGKKNLVLAQKSAVRKLHQCQKAEWASQDAFYWRNLQKCVKQSRATHLLIVQGVQLLPKHTRTVEIKFSSICVLC